MRTQRVTRRSGFTLVEMLVSTALLLFIMAILAEALGAGSKTFTTLRTAGDLQNRLRQATNILRQDLSQEKFGNPYGNGLGGPRLRDQRLDRPGWRPPRTGYVEIFQGNPSLYEPSALADQPNPSAVPPPPLGAYADGEGLWSTRARSHWMKFTVRLPVGPPSELLAAAYHPRLTLDPVVNAFPALAPMVYTRWAEVHYFLLPTPNSTPGGLPLHSLRRKVRLLPPQSQTILITAGEAAQIQADMLAGRYPDMIDPILVPAPSPPYPVNSVLATVPGPEAINAGIVPPMPSGVVHPAGDDILLQDVISFEIKAAWFNNPSFNNPTLNPLVQTGATINAPVYGLLGASPTGYSMAQGNSDEPFSDLLPSMLQPGFLRRFHTGVQSDNVDWDQQNTSTGFLVHPYSATPAINPVPTRINVRALQIKLRIWDPRAEQARQVTIVQEL